MPRPASDERLRRILTDIPVTVGRSGLILVLNGQPGTANVIAQAIEESTLNGFVGTVAGDNTLIVLFPDEPTLTGWLDRFDALNTAEPARPAHGGSRSMNKVVLAYSGGLDTSVAVAWLREQYGAEVDHAHRRRRRRVHPRGRRAARDVGRGVEGVRRRRKETFVSQYVWRALQAGAIYQGAYPLATALARPLLAQLLVEVARREGADAVAHGCTGKGNDQVRFDVAVHALDPGLKVIAPMRVGMGLTRDQSIDYANAHGIEIPITKASPYSIDVNLWGRSCETGVLEDPWVTPPEDAYAWTVKPGDAPDAGRRS